MYPGVQAMTISAQLAAGLRPDQVLGYVLLDVVIILAVARLLGHAARRIGQPSVVGEIVGGILLGPTLLGPALFLWGDAPAALHCQEALAVSATAEPSISTCLFPPQSRAVLGILGQIALVLFMFLVGLELDWNALRGRGRGIVTVALSSVGLPIALGFLIGPLLFTADFVKGFGTDDAPSQLAFVLFIASMLAVTAFPVMARILQEKGLTQTPMGAIGVAAAAIVTVLMFLSVAVASGVAGGQEVTQLATKFGAAFAFLLVLFAVVAPALAPLGRRYQQAGSLTPGVFGAVLVIVFACAYVAHQIGVNVIVGGFVAGAVLPARAPLFRDMAARLSDVTAIILLPIFLAFSGLNTDFTTLRVGHLPGIALFLVAGVAGKWLGAAVAARASGLSWAEGNVLGVLMNCRGLLVLVVALIALNAGVISPQLQVGAVLMALVTTIMTGPLFDRFRRALPTPPSPAAEAARTAPPAAHKAILAVVGSAETAPLAMSAAFDEAAAGDLVVVWQPISLPEESIVSGINDEALEVERALRALSLYGSLAPPDVTVQPLAFVSRDPTADAHTMASSRRFSLIVIDGAVARAIDAKSLAAEGAPVRIVEGEPV